MKKIFFLALLFLATHSYALEFTPNTVQEMDATIILEATGSFQGLVTNQDKMEVRFLVFSNTQNQQVLQRQDQLFIGGQIISPSYETENDNQFAVFTIENLLQYASEPDFRVESKTRVKTSESIGLAEKNNASEDLEKYLLQTDFIEVNDPILQSKAGIEFQSEDKLELVRQIAKWVNSNIEYDFENYYLGVYSAKHTYDVKAGVCDEFANLTAAFTRIKEIPTRYVTGISFDGERFGNHGWLEAFIEEYGWIGLDSTFGEVGFVDGAHFALGITDDTNNLSNLKILSTSVNPVVVQTMLKQPSVEINEVKFFSGVTSIEVERPQKVSSKEQFEVTATVRNLLSEPAIIPIELAVHEDFLVEEKLRLEYFLPNEEKEVQWQVTAPEHLDNQSFLKYQMHVFLPDQNWADDIEVHFGEEPGPLFSKISFEDISPTLVGSTLEISVKIKNSGELTGEAEIKAFKEGQVVAEKTVTIAGLSTLTESVTIENFSFGKIQLVLSDGITEKKVNIVVPEQKETPIQIIEPPTGPPGEIIEALETEKYLVPILAAVLVAVVLVGFYFMQKKD